MKPSQLGTTSERVVNNDEGFGNRHFPRALGTRARTKLPATHTRDTGELY